MNTDEWIEVVKVLGSIGALLAASVACYQTWFTRRAAQSQMLLHMLNEYRTPEMHLAVTALWDFFRQCSCDETENAGDDYGYPSEEQEQALWRGYSERLKKEDEEMARQPSDKRIEAKRTTLHYQRRLVSRFYQIVAAFYDLGLVSGRIVYSHWSRFDLRIIPKIILPIEKNLTGHLGGPELGFTPTLSRLRKLYDDCPREPMKMPRDSWSLYCCLRGFSSLPKL